jgi:hypothetical protein
MPSQFFKINLESLFSGYEADFNGLFNDIF